MKSPTAAFLAEQAKTGNKPWTLLVWHFPAPTGDVYTSDREVTLGGHVFEALVVRWGRINKVVNFDPAAFDTSDWTIGLANDGATGFSDNFAGVEPHNVTVEAYHWYEGTADSDKLLIETFVVDEVPEYNAETCDVQLASLIEKYDKPLNKIVTKTDYPSADIGDINKAMNIVVGSAENVPCVCIVGGGISTIIAEISASATSLEISGNTNETPFPSSTPFVVQMGSEKMQVTNTGTGKNWTVTRGYGGTTAVAHQVGEVIFEVTDYKYAASGHAAESLGDVKVGGLRVTSGVTKNTDDSGVATLTFSGKPVLDYSTDVAADTQLPDDQKNVYRIATNLPIQKALNSTDPSISFPTAAAAGIDGLTFEDVVIEVSIKLAALGVSPSLPSSDVTVHAGPSSSYPVVARLSTSGAITYPMGQTFEINKGTSWTTSQTLYVSSSSTGDYYISVVYAKQSAKVSGMFSGDPGGGWVSRRATNLPDVGTNAPTATFPAAPSGNLHNAYVKFVVSVDISGSFTSDIYLRCDGSTDPIVIKLYNPGGTSYDQLIPMTFYLSLPSGAWDTSVSLYVSSTDADVVWQLTECEQYAVSDEAVSHASVSVTATSAGAYVVGGKVTVDMGGLKDDGSGTYTGTPDALIESPADLARFVPIELAGTPSAYAPAANFSAARTALSAQVSGGYKFGGAITNRVTLKSLLAEIAEQSRSRIFETGGELKMVFRPDTAGSSVKSVTKTMIARGSLRVMPARGFKYCDDFIINFNVDPSRGTVLPEDAMDTCDDTTAYPAGGDKPREVMFRLVKLAAVAEDLRDFYTAFYGTSRKQIQFEAFELEAVERTDILDITHDGPRYGYSGQKIEVLSPNYFPGSTKANRAHLVEIIALLL